MANVILHNVTWRKEIGVEIRKKMKNDIDLFISFVPNSMRCGYFGDTITLRNHVCEPGKKDVCITIWQTKTQDEKHFPSPDINQITFISQVTKQHITVGWCARLLPFMTFTS